MVWPRGLAETTAQESQWRAFRTPDTAGAIYGTIAAMAVIAGAARHPSHGRVLVRTVATLVVFWLAHLYAHALDHHLRGPGGWIRIVSRSRSELQTEPITAWPTEIREVP